MWQKAKNVYHLFIAVFANTWFLFPSKSITIIGVTGTDGKTTTVSLIYHILKSSGLKASMISSVEAMINNKKYSLPFHVTTLPPFALQKFIKMACLPAGRTISKNKIRKGKNYLVLEVTSHALDQFRVFGTKFDIGVITNVSREHLDYHKTYEEYVEAKLRLFEMSKIAVLNKDDRSFKSIKPKLKKLGKIDRVVTYGMGSASDINPNNFKFDSKLFGDFNKYNILAGGAVARLLSIKDEKIREAILSFEAPIGRQEIVYDKNFKIMIDFAHTPNSFNEILNSLRKNFKGRIIHVFGSAGQRDRSKRPQMGKISSNYSDIMVITAEDPRSESIEKITEDILSAVKDSRKRIGKTIFKIPDRQEAIDRAIGMARNNDLVLITGKAHETSMNLGRGEEPWSEYDAVKKALGKRDDKS